MSRNAPLNGHPDATVTRFADAKLRRNGAARPSQPQVGEAPAQVADGGRGPAQQQPATATELIDALLTLNLELEEEVALLEEALAKANRFAFHDELTGLPNRRLLQDHFDQAVAHATRQQSQVVLLFLDLNRSKGINDALGHVAADGLLRQVAKRLTSCIRSSDTACRFGGDEFVVLLTDIESREQAAAATNKIIAQLAIPYIIDRKPIRMTAAIGMAVYPVDGKRYDDLLQAADFTIYNNKPCTATAEPGPKPRLAANAKAG